MSSAPPLSSVRTLDGPSRKSRGPTGDFAALAGDYIPDLAPDVYMKALGSRSVLGSMSSLASLRSTKSVKERYDVFVLTFVLVTVRGKFG